MPYRLPADVSLEPIAANQTLAQLLGDGSIVNVYAAFRQSRDVAPGELSIMDTLRVMHQRLIQLPDPEGPAGHQDSSR